MRALAENWRSPACPESGLQASGLMAGLPDFSFLFCTSEYKTLFLKDSCKKTGWKFHGRERVCRPGSQAVLQTDGTTGKGMQCLMINYFYLPAVYVDNTGGCHPGQYTGEGLRNCAQHGCQLVSCYIKLDGI